MVTAKKKLPLPPKQVVAALTIVPKSVLATPTLTSDTVMPPMKAKRHHVPSPKTTTIVASQAKCLKKKANKGRRETHAIFSQDTRVIAHEATHLPLIDELQIGALPDSLAPTTDQTATIQTMT